MRFPRRPRSDLLAFCAWRAFPDRGWLQPGPVRDQSAVDQIFLPSGLAVDPDGNWLYVINSNNDLRFNAGTLLALDLQKAQRDRDNPAPWPACSTTHFIDDESPETLAATLDAPCCSDRLQPHVSL